MEIPILRWRDIWLAYWRLREYEPNKGKLSPLRVANWVNQYPESIRDDVARLAAGLEYISKNRLIQDLKRLNARIEALLDADGISTKNIVYVSIDDPASSSPAMCKLLRDQGGLPNAKFVPSTSGLQIHKLTKTLESGAIVYVDDFSGTGKQFVSARDNVRDNISGNFSEFFLLSRICEEALEVVKAQEVQPIYGKQHTRAERPLHSECVLLSEIERKRLVEILNEKWRDGSLGYMKLATNIVFYHAAPNTTPMLFRGDKEQRPMIGIVPRWEDLSNE